MKKNLPSCIMDAIASISKSALIEYDNGTHGQTYSAWIWDTEYVAHPERRKILARIMTAMSNGLPTDDLEEQLKQYPQKTVFCFKLEKPISNLQGTKIINDPSGKRRILFMPNVTEIYIHQDVLMGGFVEIDEMKKTRKSSGGVEHPVLKIKLTKALLEVTEEQYDYNDPNKIYREKRAMVSNLSYRTMQILGKLATSMEHMDIRMKRLATPEDVYKLINTTN